MSKSFEAKANTDITAEKVRLVLGNESKVVTLNEAFQIADIGNTDLVQINDADVPVCKLTDFSKFKYDQKQAAKLNDKKQKQSIVQTKEIQLTTNIQSHDLEIKANSAKKFLDQGKVVLVCIKMQFRDGKPNSQLAEAKVNEFLSLIDNYVLQQPAVISGKTMSVIIKKG